MIRRRVALGLLAAAPSRAEPSRAATLPPHPRLIATPRTLAAARLALDADPAGRAIRDGVIQAARAILAQPPVARTFEAARPVLLPTSREALRRIGLLGVAHGLGNGPGLAERGIAELLAVCAFPDWNPSHFLDVAEMGFAVALGYDWLHSAMTPAQRATVRDAIVEKALRPAEDEFRRGRAWVRATDNWNVVCCGGIGVAALAVLDKRPDVAEPLLARCLDAAAGGFASFGRDGGYAEGPMYAAYAASYAVHLLAALETAGLAAPAALGAQPGLARVGGFLAHLTGPSGRLFNYADAVPVIERLPAVLWLAARHGTPSEAWVEGRRGTARPAAFDALWHRLPAAPPAALDAVFPEAAVACFRSIWDDPGATWLAIKGGDNAAPHAHLDVGSFVLEMAGFRVAAELGPDDYALPGYFAGERRWTYLRTASRGQNVLLRGAAENQGTRARAPLIGFASEVRFARAAFDLSTAYPGVAHRRGAALLDRRHAAVVDEVRRDAGVPLTWQMMTEAAVEPRGASARLVRNGRAATARLVEAPEGSAFAVEDAAAPPPENPNTGFRRLVVRLPPATGEARLVVLFSPEGAAETDLSPLRRPLDRWFA